jgi:hypothetical protein
MSAISTEVYLLIDNGLLHGTPSHYAEDPESIRPNWLEPIYDDKDLDVSPLVVNIEAAYEAGELELAMKLANERKPALHLSLIDTPLSQAELAQHLRRLIHIVTEDRKQYTLRFADGLVLATLASVATAPQWAAITRPISRWRVHDRGGSIISLPLAPTEQECPLPLLLTAGQISDVRDALEPDHVLAKVRALRHGAELHGNAYEQYEWTCTAASLWKASGNINKVMLTSLVDAAVTTRGEILRHQRVTSLLAMQDLGSFLAELQRLVHEIEERHARVQQIAANAQKLENYQA